MSVLQVAGPLGGAAVLGSYAWGFSYANLKSKDLWGPLTGRLREYWIVSALLTATSFVYLWYWWAFGAGEESASVQAWFLVFLTSAFLWMFLVWRFVRTGQGRWSVSLNLWITAIASIALLDLVVSDPDASRLTLAAAIMVMVHHVMFDAIVWDASALRPTSKTKG